jgi:hypothetical protein
MNPNPELLAAISYQLTALLPRFPRVPRETKFVKRESSIVSEKRETRIEIRLFAPQLLAAISYQLTAFVPRFPRIPRETTFVRRESSIVSGKRETSIGMLAFCSAPFLCFLSKASSRQLRSSWS